MYSFMLHQAVIPTKGFVADFTFIRFLSYKVHSVGIGLIFGIFLELKNIWKHIFFTCVSPQVTFEVLWMVEEFDTEAALILPKIEYMRTKKV